jgi:mono/diheme cytochrome c family protein
MNIRTVLKIGAVTLGLAAGANLLAADTQENWNKNCVSCHGKDGKGQTKAGRMADVKDFTDAKYQASFDDAAALKQVKEGLKDKTGKDRMKPFAEKLNDEEIKALIEQVRKFKQ